VWDVVFELHFSKVLFLKPLGLVVTFDSVPGGHASLIRNTHRRLAKSLWGADAVRPLQVTCRPQDVASNDCGAASGVVYSRELYAKLASMCMSPGSAAAALASLEAWLTSQRGIGAAGEYNAARVEAGAILETLVLEYAKDPALRSLVPSLKPSSATEVMEVTAEEMDAEANADADEKLGGFDEPPGGYDDDDGDDGASSGSSPPVSELDDDDGPDEPAPPEPDEAEVLWKHLSAADVQAKLDVMFSTEAVVFVSALLDALNADRPGQGYGSRVYQLDHLTKVLTEMNKEQLLSFDGDDDFILPC